MKERIKNIEDPEKQRKLEERENRRDKKKAQPKMKQLKVRDDGIIKFGFTTAKFNSILINWEFRLR